MENKKNIAKQINREAIITIFLYAIYFLWWYYFAYIFPPKNVDEYKYILGMPEWFFYSCVLGLILINFLVFLVTKFLFRDIDFKEFENNNEQGEKSE